MSRARPSTRRTVAAPLLTGVIAGLLLGGLLVPLTFGDSSPPSSAQSGASAGAVGTSQGAGTAPSEHDAAATSQPGAGGAALTSPGAARDPATTQDRGNDGPTAPGAGGAGGGDVAQALAGTERGVTADAVKVGIPLIDVAGLSAVGIEGVSGPEEQQQAWEAYLNDINGHGGLAGRRIDPVFRKVDIIRPEEQRQACLYFTEEAGVFAVLENAGLAGTAILCFTEEHRTFLLASGSINTPDEWYTRSEGRLFTLNMASGRLLTNWALELDSLRQLKGRRLGLVADTRPGMPPMFDILERTLNELGHEVLHRSNMAEDFSSKSSQVAVEVQQMRTKGVDTVLLGVDLLTATQFVQQAEGQGWQPQYHTTDLNVGATDTYAQNMPASFDGAIAISGTRTGEWRVGMPEPPAAAACREIYERATGRRVDRAASEDSNQDYTTAIGPCTHVRLFEMAARQAGPELTTARLSAAMANLAELPMATFGGGSYRPGKFDAPDFLRTLHWEHRPCQCWKPVDEFRRVRR